MSLAAHFSRCSQAHIRHFLLGLLLPPAALLATYTSDGRSQVPAPQEVAADAVPLSGCVGHQVDAHAGLGGCLGGMGGPAPEDLTADAWGPSVPSPQRPFAPNPGLLEALLAKTTEGEADHAHELPTHHPVRNARVSSHYGPRHDPFGAGRAFHGGIDFAAPLGTPIRSAAAGMVTEAHYQGGYGNVIKIDHGNGHTTLYAHNHKLLVRSGQMVMAGQSIALLGSTGRSTGPHLHFEVRIGGLRVDPRPFLRLG